MYKTQGIVTRAQQKLTSARPDICARLDEMAEFYLLPCQRKAERAAATDAVQSREQMTHHPQAFYPSFKTIFLLSMMAAAGTHAEEIGGTWNLIFENDTFTDTDRNYTSGVQLSYLSAADQLPGWLRITADLLPGIDDKANLRAGFQLGHSIFTPEDTGATAFLPDQRPYAGWLYGGLAVVAETDKSLDTWLLNIGVVGPWAQGEEVQNGVHELIGSPEAEGWDNQIENQFAGALIYERRWRNLWQSDVIGVGVDVSPHAGFSLGNVGTYGNGGVTLRFGNDLSNDFGPPRIRPSLPGSGYFAPRDGFVWYAFVGVDARAVGYNVLLEGDTREGRNEINIEHLVADVQAGVVVMFRSVRLGYTYVYRTEEFEGQEYSDRFGSLSLSVKF